MREEEDYDDEWEESLEEMFEEIPWETLNDITDPEEKSDVDVSDIFVLSQAQTLHLLKSKNNQKDMWKYWKKNLNFSLYPKMKLLKLKQPLNDISYKKKNKDVILSQFTPQKTPHTLDISDIEMLYAKDIEYPDMYVPEYPLKYKSYFYGKKIFKTLKNIILSKKIFIYGMSFFVFFMTLFLYKTWVEAKLYQTFEKIKNIEISQDIAGMQKQVTDLRFDIVTLDLVLKPMFLFNTIAGIDEVQNLENVIFASKTLLSGAKNIFYVYESFENLLEQKEVTQISFWDFFLNSLPLLSQTSLQLSRSIDALSQVAFEPWDPLEYQFEKWLSQLKMLQKWFQSFLGNIDILEKFLWNTEKRKYMIIFQNDDEIRPTWWFMWSVMFVEIFRGKILEIEKKDIYALEWPLKPFTQIAPEWINKLTPTFWLRDANYYVEVERSSQEIQKFLEKSWVEIDGIVYINQNVIKDVLKKTGPIYFPEIETEITHENFPWIFSTLVESKVYKSWTFGSPKQILFDFVPLFFTHIQSTLSYPEIWKSFLSSLQQRDILLWSKYEDENKYLQDIWLSFAPKYDKNLDFAYPFFTSISWNKSDRYIKRSFVKKYQVDENCTINTSFLIRSQHTFHVNQEIEIKSFLYDRNILEQIDIDQTLSIQWKAENKQFVRVYIPKNAIISPREDYEVIQTDDKKEIRFYLNTPLSTTRDFEFFYQIPNPECREYEFQFFKQSWLWEYLLEINESWNILFQWNQLWDFYFNKNNF